MAEQHLETVDELCLVLARPGGTDFDSWLLPGLTHENHELKALDCGGEF